jgi:lycopene cyclase domain-containing protein
MKQRYSFLLAYILLIGIPTPILFVLVKDFINVNSLLITAAVGFLIGGTFDIWGTKQGKKDKFFVWEYNKKSTLWINIFGVPIEDWIFLFGFMPIMTICLYTLLEKLLRQ